MQYWDPGHDRFVGDCMPFWHDGVYHLYYLLDEGHHQALGGLGGHQWAHASTRDLVHWTHHPLAIPRTHDWEGSICTGSVIHHGDTYYGFYATRMRDHTQHLAYATSADGVHYGKQEPNPLASPPAGYSPYHCRDPYVWRDEGDGAFHMLVTAERIESNPLRHGGCLAHLVSDDLRHWAWREPFYFAGDERVPECPDYIAWNGWYYLVFSTRGSARYLMSRQPLGPWERPAVDAFEGPLAAVMKTAPFGEDRRIGVAFLPTREGDRDDGARQYGGAALFREIIQHPDGTLGTAFVPEMVPRGGAPVAIESVELASGRAGKPQEGTLDVSVVTPDGPDHLAMCGAPHDARLTMRVLPPSPDAYPGGTYGLRLSAPADAESGYTLAFDPAAQRVTLDDQAIEGVSGLDAPFGLDIVLSGDIIDVCVDGRRTLVNRVPQRGAGHLVFFARETEVEFENIVVRPLLD